MKHKTAKRIVCALLAVLLALVLAVGGYVLYMQLQYYRIADHTALETANGQNNTLATETAYTAVTYNIGFGAYDQDYSFFMDTGVMLDGTQVTGKYARAQNEETVWTDTKGDEAALQTLHADFMLLQEVDRDSTRSWHVDQGTYLIDSFGEYSSTFASNFHSAYLLYPLTQPHGSVNSGLLTFSRYAVDDAVRRSYPVDDSFITKFTDLDRCFALLRIPVEGGKELVLINSHMSAYDKGGTVRVRQLELLNSVLSEEYEKGNYVIVGGDFNHALCGTEHTFETQQQYPAWVFSLTDADLAPHFSVVQAENVFEVPTCRSCDIPYTKGVNYSAVLDGFIVSDNVKATAQNIDLDFKYSDHNPVQLTFTLQ